MFSLRENKEDSRGAEEAEHRAGSNSLGHDRRLWEIQEHSCGLRSPSLTGRDTSASTDTLQRASKGMLTPGVCWIDDLISIVIELRMVSA